VRVGVGVGTLRENGGWGVRGVRDTEGAEVSEERNENSLSVQIDRGRSLYFPKRPPVSQRVPLRVFDFVRALRVTLLQFISFAEKARLSTEPETH
jgi:hypothetical protein